MTTPSLAELLSIPPSERGIKWRDLFRQAGGDLAKLDTGKSNRGRPPVDPVAQERFDKTLPQAVLSAGLSAAARRVLAVLRFECMDKGPDVRRVVITRLELARRAEIAARTVKLVVPKLEKKEFLTVERTVLAPSFNAPNLYTLADKAFRLARTGAANGVSEQKIFCAGEGASFPPLKGNKNSQVSEPPSVGSPRAGGNPKGRAAVAARRGHVAGVLANVEEAFEGRKRQLLP